MITQAASAPQREAGGLFQVLTGPRVSQNG